ncbi:hypothetical protein ACE7GA_03660 [Roseomonas sp. CCTCC AB2023176]|uniref:hypothetical protein n=1 Tax=Roseomonas sp. CCTCC AB2023176 TaxID=3342640 RepID=UPI0035DDBDEF
MSARPPRGRLRALGHGAVLLAALTAAGSALAAKARDSAPPRRDAVVRESVRKSPAAPAPRARMAERGGPAHRPPSVAPRRVTASRTDGPRASRLDLAWRQPVPSRRVPPVIPGWRPLRPELRGPRVLTAGDLAPFRIAPQRAAAASAPPAILAAARPPVIEMPEAVTFQELALAPERPWPAPARPSRSPSPRPTPRACAAYSPHMPAANMRRRRGNPSGSTTAA